LTANSYAKAVIEAALFASGRTLTPRELADLSGFSEERARALADDLATEYAARGSGIENGPVKAGMAGAGGDLRGPCWGKFFCRLDDYNISTSEMYRQD